MKCAQLVYSMCQKAESLFSIKTTLTLDKTCKLVFTACLSYWYVVGIMQLEKRSLYYLIRLCCGNN